jgi:hypothetical protein
MPYVSVEQDVWIDPADIIPDLKDEELIDELNLRGYNTIVLVKVRLHGESMPENKAELTLERLFELKRMNSPEFDRAFSDYIWTNLGKVL